MAQPGEVRLGAAEGRRVTLYEVSQAHRIILDTEHPADSITEIRILD
jgi:hypothetical protein